MKPVNLPLMSILILAVLAIPARADWISGRTSMSRLSHEEKAALINRRIDLSPYLEYAIAPPPVLESRDFPSYFNWHDRGGHDWMSPIRDQGDCGSCWAFGSLGALEGAINIYLEDPDFDYDLSEQFMVSCGFGSCEYGGMAEEVIQYLKTTGVPDEACFPYEAYEGDCDDACEDWEDRVVKIQNESSFGNLMLSPTEEWLKEELQLGPLSVTMQIDWGFYDYYSGVYEGTYTTCDLFVNTPNHIVTLVGWSDSNNSWIAKNSWGADWGENGYFEIVRGTCCLATVSANWVRVDPVTVPGSTNIPKLCTVPSLLDIELPAGAESVEPETFDLINCGYGEVTWTVRADSRLFDLSPGSGGLAERESERISIWVDATGEEPGYIGKQIVFTPNPRGEDATLMVRVHVMQALDGDEDDEPDGDRDDDPGNDPDYDPGDDPSEDDREGVQPPDGDRADDPESPGDGDAENIFEAPDREENPVAPTTAAGASVKYGGCSEGRPSAYWLLVLMILCLARRRPNEQ